MTPGQLVKAVAIALDVPEETVTQHDRNLVMAGLRTKGGRGRSAPEVTPLDAARLLVATLASVRTKDSAGTVRVFQKAILRPGPSMAETTEAMGLISKAHKIEGEFYDIRRFSDRAIDVLPENHNFIEALASLIDDASKAPGFDQLKRRFGAMTITCEMPLPIGHISRMGEIGPHYMWPKPSAAELADAKVETERHDRYLTRLGIHQRRSIYGNAIMLLGKAFRENGLDFKTTKDALADFLPLATRTKKRA